MINKDFKKSIFFLLSILLVVYLFTNTIQRFTIGSREKSKGKRGKQKK